MHFRRSCARLCMSARACARERRGRQRGTTARPLDGIHNVGMYMCECMYVHMDVRVGSMQVCVRARARRERRTRAPTRRVSLRAYIFVRMSTCMCLSARVDSMGGCACAHVRVRARGCARTWVWYAPLRNVRLYRRSCIQACMDAWIRTHTHTHHRRPHRRLSAAIPSCVHVRMDVSIRI
jgi:hypothetical protein